MQDQGATKIIRFGDYQADLRAGDLRKRGVRLRLRDQSFEVLATLLEHAGEAVTREELRKRLWPEGVFVDFDSGLNSAIARLREALGDSAERPRFIETLPKRGYRFIAAVAECVAGVPRVMVLPFTNLTGDPAQEYCSEASAEETTSRLVALAHEHLAVIACTTALHFKRSPKDVAEIGRELALDYLVEGSIRRTGDRVTGTAQLIEVASQAHVWALRFDSDWQDIFDIWDEIARSIAEQISVPLTSGTKKPTEDVQAYTLYLQGRHEAHSMTPTGMVKAKQCFEEAIQRDRGFALAYDALGELYWYFGFLGVIPPRQASSTGVLAAMRALELNPTLAETHALRGWFRKELDYNWPEVQREMSLALNLNPASPVVRYRYAKGWLLPHARVQEAAVEIESALSSDPFSMDMRFWLGCMLWLARDYDGGIEEMSRLLELDPNYTPAHFGMGLCQREKGSIEQAIEAHRRAVELSGGSPATVGWLGLTLAQSGNTDEARTLLERLHSLAKKGYVPPTSFGLIHFGLGEVEEAFVWLDRAVDARDHVITPIQTYPFLDAFRCDPRYLALLRKMKLAPEEH